MIEEWQRYLKQKFWYHYIKKPPRHLIHIVFLIGHWTKWAMNTNILAFLANFGRFWAKNPFFGEKVKLLVP